MGLLSFLSRKSTSDKPQHAPLIITQAYHSTTASAPPVKGEYPIGGNGPRNLEGITRHHGLGPSQLRLEDIPLPGEEPAPAPVVPTFRNEGAERPTTAPNARSLTGNWPNTYRLRKTNPGQPSLSTSKSERQSLRSGYASGNVNRTSSISNYHAEGAQSRPYTANQQTNAVPSSIGKGYKDLLDAQSELKSLDFRSRIKASGARDYGEDVADRNIGENGHNLGLPQVQAFYAQGTDTESLRGHKSMYKANVSMHYRRDAPQQSHKAKPVSMEARPRTKSLNASSAHTYQHQRASIVPQLPMPAGSRQDIVERPMTADAVSRHQPRNTQAQDDQIDPSAEPKGPKARRLTYRGAPPLPLSPLRNSMEMGVEGPDSASFEQHLGSPVTKHTDSSETVKPLKKAIIPATDDNPSGIKDHVRTDEQSRTTRPPSSQRSFPLAPSKPSTRRHSTAAASIASGTNRYNTHSVQPSTASSVASYHTAIDTTPFSPPSHRQAELTKAARRMSLPVHTMGETAPSPTIRTTTTHFNLSNADPHNRTKSLTTTPLKLTTEDLSSAEPVPPRTSSLRNWSISSATPTATSDTSSNPFSQRPQSRNTATTSVDLGKDFVLKNASSHSLSNLPSPLPLPQLQPTQPQPQTQTPASPMFNIDDYLSSDDDSLEPRLLRGEGEEELLFSLSGYGAFQLPGLSDTFASTPPPQHTAMFDDDALLPASSPPRSSTSLPPAYLNTPFGLAVGERRRRYILNTAADSDSSLSEDEGEDVRSWQREDEYRGRAARHTRRLSALGSHWPQKGDVIQEERDGKIDVAAAIRQRKEEKARRRGSGGVGAAASRRRSGKGKGKERERRVGGDGDGDEGDVDC